MDKCFLLPGKRIAVCHLGRHGDVMILAPAWKHIADTTGEKPAIFICEEFAPTLEGMSYVECVSLKGLIWYKHLGKAHKIAMEKGFSEDEILTPKKWDWEDRPELFPPKPTHPNAEMMTIIWRGKPMEIERSKWESYHIAQWENMNFTLQQMLDWPLIFDRRDYEREAKFAARVSLWRKPVILYSFSGISSPFLHVPEMMEILRPFRKDFDCVDIGQVRSERVYDLLGLYDRAVGLITIDSAPFHLAKAHTIKWIGLRANGGNGSIPQGNNRLSVRYHEFMARRGEIVEELNRWKSELPASVKDTSRSGGGLLNSKLARMSLEAGKPQAQAQST